MHRGQPIGSGAGGEQFQEFVAEGRVVAEGKPTEVMKDPVVVDAYLGANMDRDLGEVVKEIRASYAASRPEGGSAQ